MLTNLSFDQVNDDFLQKCFRTAYQAFPGLHTNPISLQLRALPNYTMRAQPLLNHHFFRRKTRQYRIQMSNHLRIAEHVPLADLPKEVLVGWFAHELGHIVDYQQRSAWSLLWFVIGYFLFPAHRLGAERRADLYAIEHGFGEQIMSTKRYLTEHATLPAAYKQRLQKYYLSPTELEVLIQEKEQKAATL